jgi:hypothetical protein
MNEALRVLELDGSSPETGIDENVVKKAYKRLAREHHPDKNGGRDDAFLLLQSSYEMVMNHFSAGLNLDHYVSSRGDKLNVDKVKLAEFECTKESFQSEDTGLDIVEDMVYRKGCRCGDTFEIGQGDLDEGYNTLQCPTCSLVIEVEIGH